MRELPGAPSALAIVDLDEFGELNDTFGTAAGDAVLEAMATRLADAVGERGALARIGADEFGILHGRRGRRPAPARWPRSCWPPSPPVPSTSPAHG